jgi:HSP20 family protein
LTISAEKRFDREKQKKNFKRVEHTYGYFSRSVKLPRNTDTSNITAHLDNGILRLVVPKTEKESTGQEISITEGKQGGEEQKKVGGKKEQKEEHPRTGQEKKEGQEQQQEQPVEIPISS